ncbi:DUF396 domain-containing protein [Blastomyces dermatitidis ATCC 18188]|uniref:DUF396 domain-containing protein n=1 Tax=Ajellomyces dermatitidis (strain ATCC 18188 / CBS 674.68) TaxID=653446 RepID=F2T2J5_AJEDA|nr:DUF396 domain-containing protein [Blastomyces dermatitidis ATCC 18188]
MSGLWDWNSAERKIQCGNLRKLTWSLPFSSLGQTSSSSYLHKYLATKTRPTQRTDIFYVYCSAEQRRFQHKQRNDTSFVYTLISRASISSPYSKHNIPYPPTAAMWILPLVGYLGLIVGFAFLTLAIASGLYYLSELVEEHTVLARRLLSRLIYFIIALHVLLCLVDQLPFTLCALSVISHLIYAANLRRFPIVKLTDPIFITSCLLVGLNHWLWFRYFSDPISAQPSRSMPWSKDAGSNTRQSYYYGAVTDLPSFTEVASYFGLCVWLVPFALFVSLSAGENVLPSMGSEYATGATAASSLADRDAKLKNKGMAKALVDGVREWMGDTGELMGFWRGEKTRRF